MVFKWITERSWLTSFSSSVCCLFVPLALMHTEKRRDHSRLHCPCVRHFIWLLLSCLGFCAEIKTIIKGNLGRKGLFHLKVVIHHEEKPWQELEAGAWRPELQQKPWGSATSWLAPLACVQFAFLYTYIQLIVCCALPHQAIWWRHSLPSSQVNSLYQVEKKNDFTLALWAI